MLALKCCFSPPKPPPHFPSHAPRGRRFGGSEKAPKNRQSQPFPGGLGVRPLLTPSAPAVACAIRFASPAQPAGVQQAGTPGHASPGPAGGGNGHSQGSVKGSPALFIFFYISASPAQWLSLYPVPASLAVSPISASLPPPALGLLPALGSESIRPCQPQLLHTPILAPMGWRPSVPASGGADSCSGCHGPRVPHSVPQSTFPFFPLPTARVLF
jgi:hypothetical protein